VPFASSLKRLLFSGYLPVSDGEAFFDFFAARFSLAVLAGFFFASLTLSRFLLMVLPHVS